MNHLSQIAAKLPEYGLDAMLITSESGERYALGFHGEGLLLVTREGGHHYTTDGRYIEAAEEQITGVKPQCIVQGSGHIALARTFIEERGLKTVGFESGSMTVDDYHSYADALPCLLEPAQGLLDGLRASKDEEEQAVMHRAQQITDDTFTAIRDYIKPGMTEREVAARIVYELLRRGAEKVSFDPIVASGPNGSRPHAVPGDTVLEPGVFITMDFGCKVEGYCSDMTRTVALGQPTEEMRKVYDTVRAAQQAGIAAAHAGVTGREVDAAARKVISDAGYGQYFSHSFGHSLGLDIHESPFASPSCDLPLPVGCMISAEPGIYIPGKFGVRIEDVLHITEEGCEDITHSPHDLIVL